MSQLAIIGNGNVLQGSRKHIMFTSLPDLDVSYMGLSNHVSLCVRIGRYVFQSRHPSDNALSSYRILDSHECEKHTLCAMCI